MCLYCYLCILTQVSLVKTIPSSFTKQVCVPEACRKLCEAKLKGQTLEQRKVYCKAKQREQVTHAPKPQTLQRFLGKSMFIGKIPSGGCRYVTVLWLVSGEVIGRCSRNLLFNLKLPSSTWGRGWEVACVCTQSLSYVQFFATPWTVAHQASLSMGFSWHEYWSGLPFSPPGDLPNQGMSNPCLLHWQADS